MTRVVTVAVQKGGVGKTTCAVHLVHYLAESGRTVLLIDCDTQGNATQAFLDGRLESGGASDLFFPNAGGLIQRSAAERIDLVPADRALAGVERLPVGAENEFRKNVRALGAGYDYVVIDTPPTMGFAMLAPLIASDYAFSPISPDPYSLNGVSLLFGRIQAIRDSYNEHLDYLGLLLNRYNPRNGAHKAAAAMLRETMGNKVIPHQIGERSSIGYMAYSRQPVWTVKSGSARAAAKEMIGAMKWLMTRMEK